jgi:hypothetical protein
MYSINPFIFIRNKRCVIFSEGIFALEKSRDMSLEGYAAHPVGYNSPLQIVMAVWRTLF